MQLLSKYVADNSSIYYYYIYYKNSEDIMVNVDMKDGCRKDLIVKSNDLIEASYRLNLYEQRLILF